MLNDPCPSSEQLSDFLRGRLQFETVDEVVRHLDQCPTCEETVVQLEADGDTLVSALRAANPEPPSNDERCRNALAFIKRHGREAAQRSLSTSPDPGDETVVPFGQIRGYQLLAKLGEGGMGAVFKARHTRLDKIVALKLLPRERIQDELAVARFQREMRAVGKLDHPNIVRAMDAGEVDGVHFLVMEYIEGIDLAELVRRQGRLPIAAACELIRQAAVGLDEAHDHQMVHRDIKPSNLILTKRRRHEPVLKILDMGLALLADAHAIDREGLTSTGQTMGTLSYMAPEQGGDSKAVDIRADIYSLGATLYKLLTGQTVYHGEQYLSPVQKMMALASEPAPSIQSRRPEVPDELAAIIHRMLEKGPDARFAEPSDVAEAIAPFAAGADLSALLSDDRNAQPLVDASSRSTDAFPTASDAETRTSPVATSTEGKQARPSRYRRWMLTTAIGLIGIAMSGWFIVKIRHGDKETTFKVPKGAHVAVERDGSVAVTLPSGKMATPKESSAAKSTGEKASPSSSVPSDAVVDRPSEDAVGQWVPLLDSEEEFAKWERLKSEKDHPELKTEFRDGVLTIDSRNAEKQSLLRSIRAGNLVLHAEHDKRYAPRMELAEEILVFDDYSYSGAHFYNSAHELWRVNNKNSRRVLGVGTHRSEGINRFSAFDYVVVDNVLSAYVDQRKLFEYAIEQGDLTQLRLGARSAKAHWRNVALLRLTDEQAALVRAGGLPSYPLKPITPADGWFDLLPTIDAQQGTESGDWWFADEGTLTVLPPNVKGQAIVTARLALPCLPRGSFELRTSFRRLVSKQQGIAFHLPVFGSSTWFSYGRKEPLTFAHGIDPKSQRLPDNLSLAPMQSKELVIRVDRQGELARVAALVDDVPLFVWKGDPSDLAPPDFLTVKPGGLGIGAAGRYSIEKLALRMLDGEADLFPRSNDPLPANVKTPPDYEPLALTDWVEVPLEELAAKEPSRATMKDGYLDLTESHIDLEKYAAKDMLVRASLRLVNRWNATITIDEQMVWANADGGVGGNQFDGDRWPRFDPHQWFELTLASVGDRLIAYVDGVKIHEAKRKSGGPGIPGIGTRDGTGQFRKIEVMPLDDLPAPGSFPGGWKERAVLTGHEGGVAHLAFSPTQPHLATISADGTVRIWDIATETTIQIIRTSGKDHDRALAYSPDGKKLAVAVGGDEPVVKLWDTEKAAFEEEPLGPGRLAGAFSPDGKSVVLALGEELRMIDVASRKVQWTTKTGIGQSGVCCVNFSPDGTLIATGGGMTVDLWDPATGESLGRWKTLMRLGEKINQTAFSPDGKQIAAGSDYDRSYVFEVDSGERTGVMSHRRNNGKPNIYGIAYSPDGRYLAMGGTANVVYVRDAETLKLVTELRGHEEYIRELVFSPDGKLLASCDQAKVVRLWEVPQTDEALKPEDGWLDLLPLVDGKLDTRGAWKRYGSGWRINTPHHGGIALTIPVVPEASSSYELETTFRTKTSSFCSLVLPDPKGCVALSPFHEDPNGLRVVHTDHKKTKTLQRPRFTPPHDKDLRLYVTVKREGKQTHILATIDGKTWIDWNGPTEQLESDRRSALRFSFANGYLWVKSARLHMLEGEARLLRPSPSEAKLLSNGER
ncbi:Serine/threonine-protein kinase StkP [Planctomycetes bacterium Pan216]|uniref:Serine/threonine-protein kinase StkP n=1 Tax=Kolteria novifilia TaxID=2527975 RepID=A0A518AZX3_9BACT|nr:Serine/threonine-protein kinase StkP [Planctomycetes bacterium Pan216]